MQMYQSGGGGGGDGGGGLGGGGDGDGDGGRGDSNGHRRPDRNRYNGKGKKQPRDSFFSSSSFSPPGLFPWKSKQEQTRAAAAREQERADGGEDSPSNSTQATQEMSVSLASSSFYPHSAGQGPTAMVPAAATETLTPTPLRPRQLLTHAAAPPETSITTMTASAASALSTSQQAVEDQALPLISTRRHQHHQHDGLLDPIPAEPPLDPADVLPRLQRRLFVLMAGSCISLVALVVAVLPAGALVLLAAWIASTALALAALQRWLAYWWNRHLLRRGLGPFLPQALYRALTEESIHSFMTDDSFFLENRHLLLYFLPLPPPVLERYVQRLAPRHVARLRRPGLGHLLGPQAMRIILGLDRWQQMRQDPGATTASLEGGEDGATAGTMSEYGSIVADPDNVGLLLHRPPRQRQRQQQHRHQHSHTSQRPLATAPTLEVIVEQRLPPQMELDEPIASTWTNTAKKRAPKRTRRLDRDDQENDDSSASSDLGLDGMSAGDVFGGGISDQQANRLASALRLGTSRTRQPPRGSANAVPTDRTSLQQLPPPARPSHLPGTLLLGAETPLTVDSSLLSSRPLPPSAMTATQERQCSAAPHAPPPPPPPRQLLLPNSSPIIDDSDAGGTEGDGVADGAAVADLPSTGGATIATTEDDGLLELSLAEEYAEEELVLTQAVVNALYDGIWTPLSRYFVAAAEDAAGPVTARLVTYGLGISAVSTLLGLLLGMVGYRRGVYRRPTLALGAYPRENTLYTTVMLGLAGTGVTLLAHWHLTRGKKGRTFFYSQFGVGRRSSRKG